MLGPHVLTAGQYSVDLAELTLCAWSGGVPHSPGYPLWTRLAQGAVWIQDGADPFHAIGYFGVVLAVLSALLTKDFLQKTGVNVWTATACAGLLLVVPQCIRAFSIAEVYALDLFLLASAFWSCQRGTKVGAEYWTVLGITAVILSIGHRPINIILVLAIALAFPGLRNTPKATASGIGIGITLQALLYWDLWKRIQHPETLWIDEHVQPTWDSFSRFVAGLPFEQFFLWAEDGLKTDFNPISLGVQCLGLVAIALLIPLANKRSRLSWGLWSICVWHLLFMLVFRVSDRAFFIFPVLWVGVVSLAFAASRLPQNASPAVLGSVLILSGINKSGLPNLGHDTWREPLRETLRDLPTSAVILTDDWPMRTGLVAIREMENIGPTKSVVRTSLEGGDILRLREWFQGRIPLILLEEHKEIEDVRPVRVHDARLLPLLIEQGMITEPAEAGTWAVVLDSQLDD